MNSLDEMVAAARRNMRNVIQAPAVSRSVVERPIPADVSAIVITDRAEWDRILGAHYPRPLFVSAGREWFVSGRGVIFVLKSD